MLNTTIYNPSDSLLKEQLEEIEGQEEYFPFNNGKHSASLMHRSDRMYFGSVNFAKIYFGPDDENDDNSSSSFVDEVVGGIIGAIAGSSSWGDDGVYR